MVDYIIVQKNLIILYKLCKTMTNRRPPVLAEISRTGLPDVLCDIISGYVDDDVVVDLLTYEIPPNCYLNCAKLQKKNLVGADLRNSDLTFAMLDDADFTDVNFDGSNLYGVNFVRTNLPGANLIVGHFQWCGSHWCKPRKLKFNSTTLQVRTSLFNVFFLNIKKI